MEQPANDRILQTCELLGVFFSPILCVFECATVRRYRNLFKLFLIELPSCFYFQMRRVPLCVSVSVAGVEAFFLSLPLIFTAIHVYAPDL